MSRYFVHPLPYREDPTARFARIAGAPGAVLLDAGRPGASRGRYDLMSAWPLAELAPAADESAKAFFARLRTALQSLGQAEAAEVPDLPFVGGLIGYLGYDLGRRIERLPQHSRDDIGLPDARVGLYAWALVTDHQLGSSQLVFHPHLEAAERQRLLALFEADEAPAPLPPFRLHAGFRPDLSREQYRQALERVQSYILAGDCYQVNYTQRFRAPCSGAPWQAYLALRAACPTPFAGYLGLGEGAILSLSPERFIRMHRRQVETRPIKGTRPRGRTPAEDAANAEELLASPKDRAENLMIVDLLRNDLGRVAKLGSVKVPVLFGLESYATVHHLVSVVTAELDEGRSAVDLLRAAFPGGSVTGAPKIRAMEIIAELEPTARGPYCGSIGYLAATGAMDSNIAIRTLLIDGERISFQVGGGIVADSDPEAEYQETLAKARALFETLVNADTARMPSQRASAVR